MRLAAHRMWCEDFLSAYRNAPVNRMSKYYDQLSVFVEVTGDGRWTEPAIGAHNIADRLASLNALGGCVWPVVTCQRMRSDGLIVVLAAEDGYRRQILIVHWRAASHRAVVSNHFYLTTEVDGEQSKEQDGDRSASFHSRFEGWAGRQDHGSLVRFQTALCTGLTVVRDYYTTLPRNLIDRVDCRQYDRAARFSYTSAYGGDGGGRVFAGPRAIRKQYSRLAMDNRCVRLRAVETCWSGHSGNIPDITVALIVGAVPKGRELEYRGFIQLFVIDVRTRKILNDVLCFEPRQHGSISLSPRIGVSSSSSWSSWSSSSYATSSTSSTPSSLSSLSSTSPSQQSPLQLSYATSTPSNPILSSFYTYSQLQPPSPSSNKIDGCWPTMSTGVANENADHRTDTESELTALRSRFMANTLGIRFAAICSPCAGSGSGQQQQNVTSSKLNPRQLFIGCVPLHVKYGQLKLLFEKFGEVTYVKVYEGYNKQTGAKMLHNYAFLFFKDEKSVEKAIAASPIPLDSNWNLNVSRPHHHTTTVGACDR